MVKQAVFVNNLGTEFDISAPDVNIKLKAGQLIKLPSGEIGLDPAAVTATTNLLSVVGANLASTVNGIAATIPIASIAPPTTHTATIAGSNITSVVNGVAATVDLTPLVKAAETTTILNYNAATKSLSYTDEDGTVSVIDLSALAVDVNLSSGAYDPATFVLTLTDSDGSLVTVNLADLKKTITANSTSLTLTGTGEASSPLKADLLIDPIAGNPLTVTAAGVKVTIPPVVIPATTNALVVGGGNLTSTVDGVAASVPLASIATAAPVYTGTAVAGLVPAAPTAPLTGKYLQADGTWAAIASPADFWRSGVGATTLPDGTTDLTDAIAHTGRVKVGAGVGEPVTAFTVVNSGTLAVAPAAGGGMVFSDSLTARLYLESQTAPTGARVMMLKTEGGLTAFSSVTDNGATFVRDLILSMDHASGNLRFGFYPNTRNDAGTPVNILSTDVNGNVLSHPVSELGVSKVHQAAFSSTATYTFPAPTLVGNTYTITDTVVLLNASGANAAVTLPPIAPAGTPLNAPINGFVSIGEIITIKKFNNVFSVTLVGAAAGVSIDLIAAPATYPGVGDPAFGGSAAKSTIQLKAVSPTAWIVV
jgi:hypothetical protein